MENQYYHTCGYPILFVSTADANGGQAYFLDGGQTGSSGEEPEPIDACPNCGGLLLLGDLTPEPIEEWW